MFYRLTTDGLRQSVDFRNAWAGPGRTPCWLIGGGPSLSQLPIADIAASPAPKFAVNLAGHGLLRPNFWTSYDPTARFQRSIYLDASITKFVHRCRAMDLIPESTFKVCEAPSLYFFDRAPQRGYHNFPAGVADNVDRRAEGEPPSGDDGRSVTDWQDSLIQAIDVAYQLGFRTLYLAGCEMFIRPSAEHLELAAAVGVEYQPREPLKDFFDRCRRQGLSDDELQQVPAPEQYHFSETKPLAAAIQTDFHYFRVAQYLRLARRSMSLAGLEFVSVTPDSRLNDYFNWRPAELVLDDILSQTGDPALETAVGRYTSSARRQPADLAPMRDFPPHNWPKRTVAAAPPVQPPSSTPASLRSRRRRVREAIENLPEVAVRLDD